MFKKISDLIVCPYCHKNLIFVKKFALESAIFSCRCTKYPLVEGILYLKRDNIRQKLINKIVRSKNYLYFFSFSFRSRLLFKFVGFKFISTFLNFKNLIKFITLLGFPIKFVKYVRLRNRIPSFFLSLLSFDLIRPGITLDIGCAMGQFLPFIYKHCNPKNFIGIDRDFFNLCIAKKYFAKNNTILICCDVDKGLPIKNKSVSNFFVTDTLHYIKNINSFLKDLRNASKNNAEGAIIHTLNTNVDSPPPCYGRRPIDITKVLKNNGFKDINILSNLNLWNQLNKSSKIIIDNERNINKAYVYNILFTKRGSLVFSHDYQKLLKKTKINFYQDKYLMDRSSL